LKKVQTNKQEVVVVVGLCWVVWLFKRAKEKKKKKRRE
jgi:hypothetical protein